MNLCFRLCASVVVLFCVSMFESSAQPLVQDFGGAIERGSGISIAVQSTGDRTYYNGSGGFVLGASVEFGVVVTRLTDDDLEEKSTGIGPYVRIPVVKQSEVLPVGVSLSSSYVFNFFSGDAIDALDDLGISKSGGEYFVGASIHHTFEIGRGITLAPEVETGYTHSHVKLSSGGESESANDGDVFVGLGARLVIKRENSVVSIIPRLRFANKDMAGGVAIGLGHPASR